MPVVEPGVAVAPAGDPPGAVEPAPATAPVAEDGRVEATPDAAGFDGGGGAGRAFGGGLPARRRRLGLLTVVPRDGWGGRTSGEVARGYRPAAGSCREQASRLVQVGPHLGSKQTAEQEQPERRDEDRLDDQ